MKRPSAGTESMPGTNRGKRPVLQSGAPETRLACATPGIAHYERAAGATLDEAARVDHPAHITAARLAAMPRADVRPWHVRFFLALEANVNPLFAGDGFTRRPDGRAHLASQKWPGLHSGDRAMPPPTPPAASGTTMTRGTR